MSETHFDATALADPATTVSDKFGDPLSIEVLTAFWQCSILGQYSITHSLIIVYDSKKVNKIKDYLINLNNITNAL